MLTGIVRRCLRSRSHRERRAGPCRGGCQQVGEDEDVGRLPPLSLAIASTRSPMPVSPSLRLLLTISQKPASSAAAPWRRSRRCRAAQVGRDMAVASAGEPLVDAVEVGGPRLVLLQRRPRRRSGACRPQANRGRSACGWRSARCGGHWGCGAPAGSSRRCAASPAATPAPISAVVEIVDRLFAEVVDLVDAAASPPSW